MEGGKDKGKKEEEPLDPIMMNDDQIKWILVSTGSGSWRQREGRIADYPTNTR
jgi:hypothetical protein